MIIIFWYFMLIVLAMCGLMVLAIFWILQWLVAITIAVVLFLIRRISGQRGDELWRDPFSPRPPLGASKPIPQARWSNRR